MSELVTNASGITDVPAKKKDDNIEGSDQVTVDNVSGIGSDTPDVGGTPNILSKPVADPTPTPIPKVEAPPIPDVVVDTPTVEVKQPVVDIKQPVAPIVPPAIIDIPTDPKVPALDLSKAKDLIAEGQITDLAELEGAVNRQEENDFNRMTHKAIAEERDSGFIQSAKKDAIRSANIRRMDGINTIKTQYNANLLKLELEEAHAEFEADQKTSVEDKERQREENNNFAKQFELLFATDPAGAIAMAQEYNESYDGVSPWAYLDNEASAKAMLAVGDTARVEK